MIEIIKSWIRRCLCLTLGLVSCCFVLTPPAAATPVTNQQVIEVQVRLGNSADELKFFPSKIELVAGQRYELLLDNPSPQKHYFIAKDFADASWTQKVEAEKLEVKGAIHEVEVKPEGEAEWVIVPQKPGTYDLYCSIPGHAEAGMTGKIVVASQ